MPAISRAGRKALLVLTSLLFGIAVHAATVAPYHSSDYWMYVGAYTSRGAKGVYLFKYHAATGTVEPAGLAAGRLWAANSDSMPRLWAQFRAGWPSFGSIARGVQNPLYLAVHPNQQFLYTANDIIPGSGVSAFRIDPARGKLTAINDKPSAGDGACYVTIDREGGNVLAANFNGGTVESFPVAGDGALRDPASVIHHRGWGPTLQLAARPHSIVVSPDSRFAVAADLALDEVVVYRFDPKTGKLVLNSPPFAKTPPRSGARQFKFHPGGRFGYALEEAGNSVLAMRWDSGRGTLTPFQTVGTLPPGVQGLNVAAEILVHPAGRFLYVSNRDGSNRDGSSRGQDSIAVFAIDGENGALTPVEFVPARGNRPRGMAFDPSGRYLLVANVESQNIVQFKIDPRTGRLSFTGLNLNVPYPAAIAFAAAR